MSLFSAPRSILIKKMFMKSPAEALWCCPDYVLSKQVWTIVAGRERDAQTSKFLEPIHF